ncbi:MAG TPA: transcription termination factor NusA [Blastocatellia bacterium]|nr:transcription termination factor NusA [Blastocatellia bacterium]
MSTSIAQTIELLSKEKNIDSVIIIEAMQEAVKTAARKHYKTNEDLRAQYNPDTGQIDLFAIKRVVEEITDQDNEITLQDVEEMGVEGAEIGDELQFPKPVEDLGRIAAQTAKQIIFQKVREAERNNIYDEYIGRIGELVNGQIKRFEAGGRIIVDLGKVEAVLPRQQQSRSDTFGQGDRIRVVISNVSKDSKGPQVEVSRAHPDLLVRLFEMEVPEIYDGTVQVKVAVREPGERAKIAVVSNERDVDPVGACVGMKGSRVQAIIKELRGEKIDIIEWNEDPTVFTANALSPAKVNRVNVLDFDEKRLEVVVEESQLSLAIGKHGQNVRLAARLVGWQIDIRNEEEIRAEIRTKMEEQMFSGPTVPLNVIEGLSPSESQLLIDHGIDSVEQLSRMPEDDLCEMLDISLDEARTILDSARMIVEAKAERDLALATAKTDEEGTETGEAESDGEELVEAAAETEEGIAEETATPEAESHETESAEPQAAEEEHPHGE